MDKKLHVSLVDMYLAHRTCLVHWQGSSDGCSFYVFMLKPIPQLFFQAKSVIRTKIEAM